MLLPLATALSLLATAPTFTSYGNGRFGFSIDVPSSLVGEGESSNGDGQHFRSADGAAQLVVYGTNTPPSELAAAFARESVASDKRSVTFSAQRDDWYVVSGFEGERVYYRKVVASVDGTAVFELTFPKSQKPTWDPLIGRIARSFSFHAKAAPSCASSGTPLDGLLTKVVWHHPNPEIGAQVAFVLVLDAPQCVVVDGEKNPGVRRVHIFPRDEKTIGSFEGKRVRAAGEFMTPGTVWHRGDLVLLNATVKTQ